MLWLLRQAHELSLRVPHLALRMREHSRRAHFLADHLEQVCASWNRCTAVSLYNIIQFR